MQQQQQQQAADGVTGMAATGATGTATTRSHVNGGRFDFDDGGTYCGGWEEGKAHGHGVCTGPKGQGAYSGSWHYGFEVSGVYTWPSGSAYEGQWQNGKRHGLGVEARGRWIYRGEWTQGFKGRYGVRQSNTSTAKYEGTWANGLQDGYGSETYADDGTYQGQWLRGMRHGYGVRNSAPFGKASKYRSYNKAVRASLTSLRSNEGNPGNPEPSDKRDRRVDDSRGGFVLKKNSTEPPPRRRSLGPSNIKFLDKYLKKQRSTGDLEKKGAGSGSIRSTGSTASWVSTESAQSAMTSGSAPSDSNASFVVEDEHMDPGVTETYMGEWKNDKRSGFGISERSDGLKYEGEWYANKKYGYGVTTFSNGEKEEGKYKNNVLITSQKKKHIFLMRSAKFRERIDAAVNAAQRASKIALQKADIAISRTATARGKAEQADIAAAHAREDAQVALSVAKQYAPDFKLPDQEKRLVKDRIIRDLYNTDDYVVKKDSSSIIPNEISKGVVANEKLDNKISDQNYYKKEPFQQQQLQQKPNLNQIPQNQNQNQNPSGNPHPPELPNDIIQTVINDTNTSKQDPTVDHTLRRMSRRVSGDRPYLASIGQQSSKDHFDHYKLPPSRDPSVDRYSRATRMSGGGSRQASVDRTRTPSEDRGARAPSAVRGVTPAPTPKNGAVVNAAKVQNLPFEEIIIRKRGLGQDIIPSPNQPKRTESLYAPPVAPDKNLAAATPLQRKKSLPDAQSLPRSVEMMSREEVSYLGSARREEVRRQADEKERLRANPLLYLVSPQVKDWFSRQQLVIIVLFVNISLAIMFFKLLT